MSRNGLVIEDDNDITQLVRLQLAGLSCETTVRNSDDVPTYTSEGRRL